VRNALLAMLVGAVLLFAALPLSATPAPVPLFNECPQVGQALGCSYLVEFGSKGSVNLLSDSSVKDVDGQGDILVVISDGVTDAQNPQQEMFGEQRLLQVIRTEAPSGGQAIEKQLLKSIEEFTQGTAQNDDITFVAVEKCQ